MKGTVEQQARATRTEQYLSEALVALLARKSIYKVQVRELCQEAQVNRSTFYKHYADMPGFIDQVIDHFLARMDANMDGSNIFCNMLRQQKDDTFVRCARFMSAHAPFVRAMIGPSGTPELRERIVAEWTRQFKEALLLESPGLHERMSVDILASYVIAVMWGLLEFTVRDNVKYTPEHLAGQLSYLLYDCTLHSVLNVAGARD